MDEYGKTAYTKNSKLRKARSQSVEIILHTTRAGGKIVITGVGKSGIIARKLVATCNSFGLASSFLHPTEALHGDLGLLGPKVVMLMITNSGRTPELETLLRHIHRAVRIIVICGTRCEPSAKARKHQILVLVAVGEDHVPAVSPAPTASVLAALALGDALIISVARCRHGSELGNVFPRNHPGRSIGMLWENNSAKKPLSRL